MITRARVEGVLHILHVNTFLWTQALFACCITLGGSLATRTLKAMALGMVNRLGSGQVDQT
jgi:hypothetical protein